jgi:hypothetical protein
MGNGTHARLAAGPIVFTLLAVVFSALHPDEAAAQSVRFDFDPPTPLTYVETVRTTRSTTLSGRGSQEVVGETRQRVELVRDADGYAMTVTPLSIKQIVGGRAVDPPPNPILDLITNAVFTYQLDGDGRLESMTGLEPVIERVEAMLAAVQAEASPAQREQIAGFVRMVESMLSPEALLARAKGEWDARVSGYDGAEIAVGETLTGQEAFPLPNGGSVTYYNVLRLEELVPCGEHNCARFVFKYDTDSEGLRQMLGDAFEPMPEVAIEGVSVTGGGERIIDPDTLLVHSEVNERTITFAGTFPGQPDASGSRYEKREYSYDYSGSSTRSP